MGSVAPALYGSDNISQGSGVHGRFRPLQSLRKDLIEPGGILQFVWVKFVAKKGVDRLVQILSCKGSFFHCEIEFHLFALELQKSMLFSLSTRFINTLQFS